MPLYFIERGGCPERVDYKTWEGWCARNDRKVAHDRFQTMKETIEISTSFLAIDNDYDLRNNEFYNLRLPPAGYEPLLYATVIFPGGFRGLYASRPDAERGHKDALALALNGTPLKDIMPRIAGIREPRSQPVYQRRDYRDAPAPPRDVDWAAPLYTGIFSGGTGGAPRTPRQALREALMSARDAKPDPNWDQDPIRPSQSPPEPPGPAKSEVVRRFEGLDFDDPKEKK